MTADEIRDWDADTYNKEVIFYVLREIAAQLAELNQKLNNKGKKEGWL